MLLTSSVLSTTSKQCFELTSSVLSTTSKQCFELTSSVLSTTSKQYFEQPAASFLVCSLIFIEYRISKSLRNPRQDNPDAGFSFKKMSIDLTSNLQECLFKKETFFIESCFNLIVCLNQIRNSLLQKAKGKSF